MENWAKYWLNMALIVQSKPVFSILVIVILKMRVRPSAKEWFSTARNYALFSNESGLYDEILSYLDKK